MGEKRVVKVCELGKENGVKKYQDRLNVEWQKVKVNRVRGVGEKQSI